MSVSIPVTVAVPTYNREKLVGATVAAILENAYQDFELLVIDQSESDGTASCIEADFGKHPRFRYIRTDRIGLSHARSIALHKASGGLILYTDDDVIVSQHWIASYVRCWIDLERQGPVRGSDWRNDRGQLRIPAALVVAGGILLLPVWRCPVTPSPAGRYPG